MLSATDDGDVVVGNAVHHPDAGVEVLLIYTVAETTFDSCSRPDADDATAGQCMMVALRGLPEDAGADNAVVIVESAAPVAQPEHAGARELAVW